MDESKLLCFVQVARHKSFSKAAQKLHVVSSTISRQIAALEDELDAQLFYRDTHNVELTPAGQRLYDASFSYFEHFRYVNENARNLMHQEEQRITMVASSFEFPLASPLMALYRQTVPDAALQLTIHTYHQLLQQPVSLFLSLRTAAPLPAGWEQVTLGRYRWKVAARRESPFWSLPPRQQALLRDQQLISHGPNTPEPVKYWLQEHGIPITARNMAGALNTTNFQLSLGGVAILPEYLEHWLPDFLRMEQVFTDPPEAEAVLILNPDPATPLEVDFFENIRDHYKP